MMVRQILPGTGRCPEGAEGSRVSANAMSIERGDPSVSPTPMAWFTLSLSNGGCHLPVPGRILR